VGSHARDRSPFGVLDLAGNVKEFTSTPYSRPGDESVLTDDFATKGGSFASYDATSDEREAEMPSISSDTEKGFRCAK
jgi:formylglycine-generating enzyme required for sulfatase activity